MTIPLHDSVRETLLWEAMTLASRLQSPNSESSKAQISKAQISDRLQTLSQQLETYGHAIQIQPHPIETIPLQVRRSFVEAIALLPQFAALFQPAHIRGTLHSPTLKTFRSDPVPLDWPQDLTQLAQQFALPVADVEGLKQKQVQVKLRCDRQRLIAQALLREIEANGNAVPLFHQLFGPVSIPYSALTYVATEMQLIFALDYEEDVLRSSYNVELSIAEAQDLQAFLQRLNQFSFRQLSNFPSFGPLDPTQVNPQLVKRIVAATGLEAGVVLRSLGQIIGLIPTDAAEMFLIHDICGHFWQLLLTSFPGDYSCLAQMDAPLKPGLAAYGAEGPLALREVFVWRDETVVVDEAKARYFFRGEVRQRMGHLLTHLMAEMLADMQEFKWGWRHQAKPEASAKQMAEALPSSSVLSDSPVKLDLTLRDVNFFLPPLFQPLLEVGRATEGGTLLEQELLLEQGKLSRAMSEQLHEATVQLQQVFWMDYLEHFPAQCEMLLANLLQLQTALNQLYTSSFAQQTPWQDLLLLFVGAYCGEDCYADFWALDDDLAEYFISCWFAFSPRI